MLAYPAYPPSPPPGDCSEKGTRAFVVVVSSSGSKVVVVRRGSRGGCGSGKGNGVT